jgi:dTDP-4-dehydrorhamnose 3,5-epimerase
MPMLPGVAVRDIKKTLDERGSFAEIVRKDWEDFLGDDRIVQANLSNTLPGIVRAWHRHSRGQVDYLVVLRGTVKICAYDDNESSPSKGNLDEIVASDEKLQLVRVPGNYWHGTKTIGDKPSLIVYLVTRLYDAKNPDEERRPWNDSTIIDPRTKRPFDWNKPSHK